MIFSKGITLTFQSGYDIWESLPVHNAINEVELNAKRIVPNLVLHVHDEYTCEHQTNSWVFFITKTFNNSGITESWEAISSNKVSGDNLLLCHEPHLKLRLIQKH